MYLCTVATYEIRYFERKSRVILFVYLVGTVDTLEGQSHIELKS